MTTCQKKENMLISVHRQDHPFFVLDLDANYKAVLVDRYRALLKFVDNNKLEEVMPMLQRRSPLQLKPEVVNQVVMGSRGLLNSTLLSLQGRNPYKPSTSAVLTRTDGEYYLTDGEGGFWLRGVVVRGVAPFTSYTTNEYSHTRRLVAEYLELPQYVRYQISPTDNLISKGESLVNPTHA
jgi:hypothetical protein